MKTNPLPFCFALTLLCTFACKQPAPPSYTNWAWYLGDEGTNHYTPLTQINKENVQQLQLAWTYHSGDADPQNRSQIQCNPLVIDGRLYGSTPTLKLVALDAATGKELWRFDPFADSAFKAFGMGVNRGLAYWEKGQQARLLYAVGSYLYAVNPQNGQLYPDFGQHGRVDLHEGLGEQFREFFVSANSPGIVYHDLIIMGMRVSEAMGAAPGYIRAYDVKTGERVWTFHTIPRPGEYGYESWPPDAWKSMGGANCWSGFSLDPERGMVFVPTGSASYDFYGGDRHGANLFANCILALDAATGKRIWHFQTVHHDLWDRDLPAPPNLITVNIDGKKVDAVAQITKSGYVFLLDRETGEPLIEVEEVPVPPSTLEGEAAWPTQPIPVAPPPFARHRVHREDLTTRTPEAAAYALDVWTRAREGDPFVPPSEEGTIIFPGFDGGGEWGGAAVDPNGILYVNASEMPWIIEMVPVQSESNGRLATRGRNIFNRNCMSCHGKDLKGASIYTIPSLVNLKSRMDAAGIAAIVKNGRGMMPSFSYLNDEQIEAIAAYLLESDEQLHTGPEEAENSEWKYPYVMTGYKKFIDPDGFPAIKPPWGTLNAIDLNKGEIRWKTVLGDHPGITDEYPHPTGTESYGGPVVTASGLLFIAATLDEKIRAFDCSNGELLWEASLPAAGYATPSVYAIDGRQYLVIACGGGKLGTKSGDAYVAFALPDGS
ncbi:MAG: pyrroloquinoline quinone-dependent dehydrogenase [Bacteroidetes bacterium]|nr:MAG: pyrroloquinoline quinone-dependent dehydrogenase [Bacteroidota bacterium]